MNADLELRAQERFFDLLELSAEAQRVRLDELRSQDAALADRVLALLRAESRADRLLGARSSCSERGGEASPAAAHLAPGERPKDFGPYQIGELLGEGGFATVWKAQQSQPVQRIVALKVMKAAGAKELAARFLAERQALARMDHAGIAKVLDGGQLDDGRLWFAMEWIDGPCLTDPEVLHELDLAARLRLFQQVARAVQHAHQKGILHRDLKPSNVLVARVNGEWTPKVIDFGIAKALEEPLIEQTLQTRAGQVIGTPAFLAPEQLDGGEPDTRTDIYALGALLFGLLAGVPPFDPEALLSAGWTGLLRTVREKIPLAPSERSDVAAGGCDPRVLRGDLSWIALRCLEKEPERRYASVAVLIAEIDRYFAGLPVLAGPPEFSYRMSKFVRRHRAALATAAVFLLALIGLTGIALHQAKETRVEAGRYGEIANFFESIFHGLDPSVSRSMDTELLELLLAEAEDRIAADADILPEVHATVLRALGGAYRGMGDWTTAEARWREALRMRRELLADDSADVLESLEDLGTLLLELKRLDEAEPLLEAFYQGSLARFGAQHEQTRRALGHLAFLVREQGDGARSAEMLEEILAAERAKDGSLRPRAITYLNGLAFALSTSDRDEEAYALYKEALELQLQTRDETHPQVLSALNNMGSVLLQLGRASEAQGYLERAVAGKRAILAEGHPAMVPALNNLARAQMEAGNFETAVLTIAEGIAIALKHDGPEGFRTIGMQYQKGVILERAGRFSEAIELLEASLPFADAGLGPTHFLTVSTAAQLGLSLRLDGQAERAEPFARRAAEAAEVAFPEGHPNRIVLPVRLATTLTELENDAEARTIFEAHADAVFALPNSRRDQQWLAESMAKIERRAGNEEAARAWEARALGS